MAKSVVTFPRYVRQKEERNGRNRWAIRVSHKISCRKTVLKRANGQAYGPLSFDRMEDEPQLDAPVTGKLRFRGCLSLSGGSQLPHNRRPLSISRGPLDHIYWINEICILMSTALVLAIDDVLCGEFWTRFADRPMPLTSGSWDVWLRKR
ncbi:hypothetical protein Trydic_g12634 [Trypoxylus dichotomus]